MSPTASSTERSPTFLKSGSALTTIRLLTSRTLPSQLAPLSSFLTYYLAASKKNPTKFPEVFLGLCCRGGVHGPVEQSESSRLSGPSARSCGVFVRFAAGRDA